MAKSEGGEQKTPKETKAVERELAKGEVEIELIKPHGGCQKGAKRIYTEDQARVLVEAGFAKIVREYKK